MASRGLMARPGRSAGGSCAPRRRGAGPADTVYRNGFVYTVDAHGQRAAGARDPRRPHRLRRQRRGRRAFVGAPTPRWSTCTGGCSCPDSSTATCIRCRAARSLLKCSLELRSARHRARCRQDPALPRWTRRPRAGRMARGGELVPGGHGARGHHRDPGDSSMRSRRSRPILVESSFGHTALAQFPRPRAWRRRRRHRRSARRQDRARRGRQSDRNPGGCRAGSGALAVAEADARRRRRSRRRPRSMRCAGRASPPSWMPWPRIPALAAFCNPQRQGKLTARAHFALLITPPEGRDPEKAAARRVGARAPLRSGHRSGRARHHRAQREIVPRRRDHCAGASRARCWSRYFDAAGPRCGCVAGRRERTADRTCISRPMCCATLLIAVAGRGVRAAHACRRRPGGARGSRRHTGAARALSRARHSRRDRARRDRRPSRISRATGN